MPPFDLKPPAGAAGADPKVRPAQPTTAYDQPPDLIRPMDVKGLRNRIYDHAMQAVQSIEPVKNSRYQLHIENPRWIDPETWSPAHQKKVFYQGGTLARRIAGDWVLTDVSTNKPVSRKSATIAAIPHLNDRGLFLLNGSHWHLGSQTRLDPGAYPRRQANGEIEAYVNPKGGRPHRVSLDPAAGTFHLEMGSSKIPLLPILKVLGADNNMLHDAWGHELVVKNAEKTDGTATSKLIKKLYDEKGPPAGMTDKQAIEAKLANWKMDPYVTSQTIGQSHDTYGLDSLLNTTKRLLAVNRGEHSPVERDHQAFQHVLGQEHLFAERIKQSRQLLNQLLWKSTFKGSLDSMPSGALNHHVLETITGTGLGVNAQMTNPAEMLDALYRVSKMGAGGIRSLDAVPDDTRQVHSSQFNYIDPVVTPESGKVGVDLRFASGSARDKQGRIYSKFTDASGRPQWLTARALKGKTIAQSESYGSQDPIVGALRDGEFVPVPRNKVDLYSAPTEMAFSPVANLVPFKSASPAHRTAMGTRMTTQALPLVGAESPLVQSGHPEGGSFEEKYGQHFGAIKAEQAGRVVSVSPDAIKVRYHDGTTNEIKLHQHDLYDHAPGRKTHFTQSAVIRPGETFQPGQLLAKSNYTDNQGRVALGANARVAWLPARNGAAFEDAFAVSQSFADKQMKSDHMSLHSIEEPGTRFGKKEFRALFPAKYAPDLLKNLDDNGVIKPGAVVQPGQPLVLASRQMDAPRTTLVRSPRPIHQDVSEVWDHDYPGTVQDVVKTRNGYRVSVQSSVPMVSHDKISGRHGNKGIVTIIPDHEMPVGEDGKPFEVIASPYTLSSRMNDSQIAELALGKIAAKTGKPYAIPDFKLPDLMKFVQDELKKHNMSSTETVFDPVTGTKIPDVLTGNQYYMKLHHLVEEKLKQRDTGGYDSFGTPARGGPEGAKRMALADTFALLAHGAKAFLRGTQNVRGQRNEGWWEATMSGYTPHMPGESPQYQRYIEGLKASGIHPVNDNGKLRLKALTDSDVLRMAGDRELQNAEGIDWSRGGDPVKGGLFDRGLHGEDHSRWSKMTLHMPMPNPAFEDPIRYTLGLTEKQMRNVLAGKGGFAGGKYLEPQEGQELPKNYHSGPAALKSALQSIDVDREIAKANDDIAGTKKTKRDQAIRKLKYLQGAQTQGLHPADWMIQQVPVLPPKFRPISRLRGSNTELISDPNHLYSDLFHANKNLKDLSARVGNTSDERLALYDALKAVSGLGDPINPKTQQKGAKGILKLILAESPKWSIPQNKLLSSPVDLVGRSTIGPDANLDMDEIGLPESMAFKLFGHFITKRLVQGGMSPNEAVRHLTDKSSQARRALLKEMEERPVSYHRAPVLHKYGHIGGWAKLVKGDGLKMSPFVYKGAGADNDGDTINVHVPIYDEEIDDIKSKMMPSRNLLSVKDFAPHYKPEREFHVGLWKATEPQSQSGNQRERVFADAAALKRAFKNGEISIHDRVVVMKH